MGLSAFDKKFGPEFISALPAAPAVYFFYGSSSSEPIYVGKAKNLRRRLSQYRNAKRRKKHHKMRLIVAEAERLEFRACESDAEASLLEAELIQKLRPKWNVAGAFSFMYPMIGMKREEGHWALCFTTTPSAFGAGWELFGAFRSRQLTGEAFFSLVRLLRFVAHATKEKRGATEVPKYSYVFRFRGMPEAWDPLWKRFFRGESSEAMEQLVLGLVENAGARGSPRKIQDHLNDLKRLWRAEIQPLKRAREASAYDAYPVRQEDRDALFIRARFGGPKRRAGSAPGPAPSPGDASPSAART